MRWNEQIAQWVTRKVGTMGCAYLFAFIAMLAFPQAIHDTFSSGVNFLPMVTWLSQAFLQLVLLSIVMVGQDLQSRVTEQRAVEQHAAVLETLADVREDHAQLLAIATAIHDMTHKIRGDIT